MTITDEPVTGEIMPYTPPAGAVEEYRPRIVMTPEDAKALDDQLRESQKAILREGVDFGTIPGAGDKKNLLKPGAEKLLQWFGFGSRSVEIKIERDDPDNPSGVADKAHRIGVTYRTEVTKTIPGYGEIVVATCEGYAGYDEDRYFATAEQARAKAKAKEERYAKADNRQPKAWKWESITEDYRAPWNTLIKMAQKRSYVGAAIDATSAAGLFTQDMEDAAAVADPVSNATVLSDKATAAIMVLPVEARKALDRWCREQGWPSRSEWGTDEWVIALVEAGRIAMEQEFAKHGVEIVKPGEADAWATPEGGEDWVTEATQKAAGLASKDAGRVLYAQAVAKLQAGEITKEQKDEVCNLITAAMADLDDGIAGTVAAPDGDPWQADIDAMTTQQDALPLLDKLETARKGGVVDGKRYTALKAAIRSKASSLPSAPGEAA